MAEKRVFKKIRCVCGREIGKNAIKRHRGLCAEYWKNRAIRAERKKAASDVAEILPTPVRVVRVRTEEE